MWAKYAVPPVDSAARSLMVANPLRNCVAAHTPMTRIAGRRTNSGKMTIGTIVRIDANG